MRKIPTLFVRNPDDMSRVLSKVHPDCQWVLDGQGLPLRKHDGTCIMYDGERWWARREVKPGKTAPEDFVPVQHDENTKKTVGWEPARQSAYAKYLMEAHGNFPADQYKPGTYELCGPKVNGNPENLREHQLFRHDEAEVLYYAPRDFDGLAKWLADFEGEGIVWHWEQPDGSVKMAKLKRKDFGYK